MIADGFLMANLLISQKRQSTRPLAVQDFESFTCFFGFAAVVYSKSRDTSSHKAQQMKTWQQLAAGGFQVVFSFSLIASFTSQPLFHQIQERDPEVQFGSLKCIT